MLIRTLAAMLCLAFCSAGTMASTLSITQYGDYELNTSTNIVSGSNKEWLQWTETSGMSPQAALALYGGPGGAAGGNWRIATASEINNLYNTFFEEPTINFSLGATSTETHTLLPLPSGNTLAINFIALFGDTYAASTGVLGSSDDLMFSETFYGCGEVTPMICGIANVRDDYINLGGVLQNGELVRQLSNFYSVNDSRTRTGVALVRDISAVPLPAAGWLFISGLITLIGRQRFLQKRKDTYKKLQVSAISSNASGSAF